MSIVGQNIRKLREHLGDSQSAFAARFGLSRGKIASYEAEDNASEPSLDTVVAIVDNFNIDLRSFVADPSFDGKANGKVDGKVTAANKTKGTKKEAAAPPLTATRTEIIVATQDTSHNATFSVVGHKAAANFLSGYQSQEYFENLGAVTLPRQLVGGERQGLLYQIEGDSMEIKFKHGDWVACTLLERGEWHKIVDLDCYVVVSHTKGIQFKRIKNRLRENGFIRCRSDNRRHAPFNIEEEDLLQLYRFVLHVSPDASNPNEDLYKKVEVMEDTTTDLRMMYEHMLMRQEEVEKYLMRFPHHGDPNHPEKQD